MTVKSKVKSGVTQRRKDHKENQVPRRAKAFLVKSKGKGKSKVKGKAFLLKVQRQGQEQGQKQVLKRRDDETDG